MGISALLGLAVLAARDSDVVSKILFRLIYAALEALLVNASLLSPSVRGPTQTSQQIVITYLINEYYRHPH